jgi:uncharacterized membrane protein (UPF0182 family)
MPFLRFLFEWAFAALVIVFIVTTVAHYLNGGIRLQGPLQRVTPQVKAHLSLILGAIALLKAFGYWLERYDLNFSSRGAVEGASYTDVKAQLPALNMLIVISVAAAILLIVNIRLRGWVMPVIAVGLWSFVSVVIGAVYPAIIQRFSVEPNELQKEKPYIERNIEATRKAFGLTGVTAKTFDYGEDLTGADIDANRATIGDARLWDPDVLRSMYTEIQRGGRSLYQFGDADIDRYSINGESRQVVIAARELDLDNIPSRTWQNQHLVYTHGYGIVASPSNAVSADGQPEFIVKDIPPRSPEGVDFKIDQPAIYYGEGLPSFAIVKTNQKEFHYPKDPNNVTTTYGGDGGVRMSNFMRRAAFALRFGDLKVMISDQVTAESRVLFMRDIRDRVKKAAPFLRFDADPYPVLLSDGRVRWVIDGYTASSRYPYAESSRSHLSARLDDSSGLKTGLNYVRNSVKATVDAYDGEVRFYDVSDAKDPNTADPIIKAYRKAFPKLFRDRSEMPEGLEEHLRYPEDLFRIQTDQYASYHVTDPDAFYGRSAQWAIAQDPGTGILSFDETTTATSTPGTAVAPNGRTVAVEPAKRPRMDPYYLQMRLPGQEKEGFLILQPFVPIGAGGRELSQLQSFMVAKSDPGEYGKLEAYTMPSDRSVLGPEQVNATINATPEITDRLTPLTRAGSQVRQGSMLLIPIENSILYIRPLYLQGAGQTKIPEFKFVAVVYGSRAVLGTTLNDALGQIFEGLPAQPAPGEDPADPGTPTPPGPGGGTGDVASLLARADTAYAEAQAALKTGDLAGYQEAVDRLAELVRQARSAAGATPADDTPASSTTTTAPSD